MIDLSDDNYPWESGQRVKVIDGPFKEFAGVIDRIDSHRKRIRVKINLLWRDTPVELMYNQVEPVDDHP